MEFHTGKNFSLKNRIFNPLFYLNYFRTGSQTITSCAEEEAYVPRFLTLLSDQFECIETTVVEEVMEVVEDTMDDLFDMLRENAPAAAAAGGSVAAGALAAMPPLPMVAAGGAPPGNALDIIF